MLLGTFGRRQQNVHGEPSSDGERASQAFTLPVVLVRDARAHRRRDWLGAGGGEGAISLI